MAACSCASSSRSNGNQACRQQSGSDGALPQQLAPGTLAQFFRRQGLVRPVQGDAIDAGPAGVRLRPG